MRLAPDLVDALELSQQTDWEAFLIGDQDLERGFVFPPPWSHPLQVNHRVRVK
ncbi:MAG: hypothetical protein ACK49N_00900 [Verrucomicrobiota bacterium]